MERRVCQGEEAEKVVSARMQMTLGWLVAKMQRVLATVNIL